MFAGIDTVQVNPRRRWTALVSFTLQAAALAVAFVLPLLHPESLPEAFARRPVFVPMGAPETPPQTPHQVSHGGRSGSVAHARPVVVTRDNGVHFPGLRNEFVTSDVPPDLRIGPSGDPGVLYSIGNRPAPLPPRPAAPHRTPVSEMMQGNLIYRFEPVYPALAKAAGVQGAVRIKAVISAQGRIEQEQVVSGSPLLVRAALDAVKQWRYRPYYLNGMPIEVETEITVNFVLH